MVEWLNFNERNRIMTKQYIQPSVEVNAMNAVQNLMSASNPWNPSGIQQSGNEIETPQY